MHRTLRRSSLTAVAAAFAGLTISAGLAACTSAADAERVPAPTATVTSTVTATPSPMAPAGDDPITPLSAWTSCAIAAQHDQIGADVHIGTFAESATPQTNSDGSFTVFVPVTPTGQGTYIYVCQVTGTLANPKLISATPKD